MDLNCNNGDLEVGTRFHPDIFPAVLWIYSISARWDCMSDIDMRQEAYIFRSFSFAVCSIFSGTYYWSPCACPCNFVSENALWLCAIYLLSVVLQTACPGLVSHVLGLLTEGEPNVVTVLDRPAFTCCHVFPLPCCILCGKSRQPASPGHDFILCPCERKQGIIVLFLLNLKVYSLFVILLSLLFPKHPVHL